MGEERRRDHPPEDSLSSRLSPFSFFFFFFLFSCSSSFPFPVHLSSSFNYVGSIFLFSFSVLSCNVEASTPLIRHSISSSSFLPTSDLPLLLSRSPRHSSESIQPFSPEHFHPSLDQDVMDRQSLHLVDTFPGSFSSFLHEANGPENGFDTPNEDSSRKRDSDKEEKTTSSSPSSRPPFRCRVSKWLREPRRFLTRGFQRVGRHFNEFLSRRMTHPSRSRSHQGEVSLPIILDSYLEDPGRPSLAAIVKPIRHPSSLLSSSSSLSEGERWILEGARKKISFADKPSLKKSVILEDSRNNLYLRLENKGLLSLDEGKIDYAVDYQPLPSRLWGRREKSPGRKRIHLLARVLFHTSLSYRARRRDVRRKTIRRRRGSERVRGRSSVERQGDDGDAVDGSGPLRNEEKEEDEERRRRTRELEEETREMMSTSLLLRLRYASLLKFLALLQCPDVDTAYSRHRLLAPVAILSVVDIRPGTLLTISVGEEKRKKNNFLLRKFLQKRSHLFAGGNATSQGQKIHFLNEVLIYPRMDFNLHDFIAHLSSSSSSSPFFLSFLKEGNKMNERGFHRPLPPFSFTSRPEEREKRWREARDHHITAAKGSLTRQIIYILRNLSRHGLHHKSPGVYSFEINEEGYVLLTDLEHVTLDPSRSSSSSLMSPRRQTPQDSPRKTEERRPRKDGEEEEEINQPHSSSSSSLSYPRPEHLDLTLTPPEVLKLYLLPSSFDQRNNLQAEREEDREKKHQFLPLSASPAIDAWRLGSILYYIWCHSYLIPLEFNPGQSFSSSSRFIRMSPELAIEALKVIDKKTIDFSNSKTCPGGEGGSAIPYEMKVLLQRLLDKHYQTRLLIHQIPVDDPTFIDVFHGKDSSSSSSREVERRV